MTFLLKKFVFYPNGSVLGDFLLQELTFELPIDIIIMMDNKFCPIKKEGQNFCHLQ